MGVNLLLPPARSCGKVMFSQVCVKNSVQGACVAGGACLAGGHVWQGTCMAGGMCGGGRAWQGACVAGGRACLMGACMAGGHVWQGGRACLVGACMAGGMHGRGVCVAGGMCGSGGACMAGGHVWQENRPLQWVVCILLECILVWQIFFQKLYGNEKNWTERGCTLTSLRSTTPTYNSD